MFTFYIENHEPFGPLTKNFPKLDKNKSIVSRFSIFVVHKSAVSTAQKSNCIQLGGGGGGSRILDKNGDGLWIFNFQPTGLWI